MEASEVEFAADSGAELDGPEGEGEGAETDDQNPYCFCRKPSWGEMIGCEDDDCDFQWFHIGCVNVSDPDMFDKWYCETCQKRTGKKPILKGQGGKGNGPTGGSKKSSAGGMGTNGMPAGAAGPGNGMGTGLGNGMSNGGNGNRNAAKSRNGRK
ncbi:hypothetical protein DACRYDRAFT_57152 [Dacryopinax primogenitus]|uniref:PHD-type domain-containing protein n=1 Tax=Dacryopinax primogenitus (strain DJM 731) TaxID=1858805 RepID=M5FTP8_DACPD|nr:uncharacterized protein DACRYDRAFT_57152 [Dacryopinax primogenitus]EJT98799.1 hypothetical protein DACRYDRAFT_57152 [Dacryopinax primogenitus]